MNDKICECGKGHKSNVDGLCCFCREKQYSRADCKDAGVKHRGDGLTIEQAVSINRQHNKWYS